MLNIVEDIIYLPHLSFPWAILVKFLYFQETLFYSREKKTKLYKESHEPH